MIKKAKDEAIEPAFPRLSTDSGFSGSGLSKREYFAAMALQGYIALYANSDQFPNPTNLAKKAVECANALLEELYP